MEVNVTYCCQIVTNVLKMYLANILNANSKRLYFLSTTWCQNVLSDVQQNPKQNVTIATIWSGNGVKKKVIDSISKSSTSQNNLKISYNIVFDFQGSAVPISAMVTGENTGYIITDISMNSWTEPLERWRVWSYADHKAIRGWYCYYRVLTHEIAFIFSFSENLNTHWKLATNCEYQNTNQYVE